MVYIIHMFENLDIKTILEGVPEYESKYRSFMESKDPGSIYELMEQPGKNLYRLLAYLSTKYENINILDISSYYSKSSLVLSHNPTNQVHTFNAFDHTQNQHIRGIDNIHLHAENLLDPVVREKWSVFIKNCQLILFDMDPHNGHEELAFYQFLKDIDYQGTVIFDDIWYFKPMRDEFWYKIPDDSKYDLTLMGHWSGTGAITMGGCPVRFPKPDLSNWTLVTAYFDLSKSADANYKIKERDAAYYMSHARSTMCLPYNLVVYCDEESLAEIQAMRPAHLADRTTYKIRRFYDLRFQKNGKPLDHTFADHRDKVAENRKTNNYYIDNRNTPSYYMFCMARYLMLKEVIDENYFGSTHFAWINFCIERMGYQNLVHLEEALACNRNRFSTCYIDYIPEHIVRDVPQYYWYGRCSMCSGFFTGNAEYMYKACDLIEDRFLQFLEMGHGHADEQLYSAVYFDYPEIFDHYYGDYLQMITNYKYIYDAPDAPINNFIRNSYDSGAYAKCLEACKAVLKSHFLGKCEIPKNFLDYMLPMYMTCKIHTKDMSDMPEDN